MSDSRSSDSSADSASVSGSGSGAPGPGVPKKRGNAWRRRSPWIVLGLSVIVLPPLFATFAAPYPVRWRARLFWERVSGDYREIPMASFVRWLRPNSDVDLFPLVDSRNVRAAIQNKFVDEGSATEGARVYATNCARCHGENAKGGLAPSLVSSIAKLSDWSYFATAKWGRPGTLMQAQPVSDRQVWLTHSFVRRLLRAESSTRGAVRYDVRVDPNALVAMDASKDEWLTYAGNYRGHRHTELTEITSENVHTLGLAWAAQLRTSDESSQGSPVVAGGLVFATAPGGKVMAFDAGNGKLAWDFVRTLPPDTRVFGSTGNRGVAILGDSVFVATLDAHLLALEASTGRQKWDVQVADNHDAYTMTAAPLAVRDRVVVGVAGGDYGARGFVAAYSVADGSRLWRFNTVPDPGEYGHETWGGDSWKHGGAATWVTGAYDRDQDLVYWGVANAAPVYRADLRPGDNLFSMCGIALELGTGKRRWHFQFTPTDEHDYDATEQPVVADVEIDGKVVSALLWANRNGFFYALDRRDGHFLYAKPFVKQTWAKGFDSSGRPDIDPGSRPSPGGTLAWPWVGGATNWQPPSYDPKRALAFVPTVDAAGLFFRDDTGYEPGMVLRGGASRLADNQPGSVGVTAIDAKSGETRWSAKLEQGLDIYTGIGGVLSTAGGVVFVGYRDEFIALGSDTGQVLWRVHLGGRINGAPIAYAAGNHERIAILAGASLFTFALPEHSGDAGGVNAGAPE